MTAGVRDLLQPALLPEHRTRAVATVALGVAGILHTVLAIAHLGVDVRLFVLLVAAGAMQVVAAPAVWRGPRPVRDTIVIAVTAALFLVDIGVRNVGLPVGSAAGLPLDPTGIALALSGGIALATLPAALPHRWRVWTGSAVALIAVGVWSVWVAGLVL
jgi:hypothetical protein